MKSLFSCLCSYCGVPRALAPVALGLTLIAGPVAGSDGVIEINQARALAGGVTAGDSAGFPVVIDEPGSYRLTSNLVTTGIANSKTTNIVNIDSPGVTLDLNGFSLIGPASCSGEPLVCSGGGSGVGLRVYSSSRGARVLNGSILGAAGDGISASYATIEGVSVSQSGGSYGVQALSSQLIDVSSMDNAGAGFYLAFTTATRCSSFKNAGNGVEMWASGTILKNCVVEDNEQNGLLCYAGSVHGSSLTRNDGYGISGTSCFLSNAIIGGGNTLGNLDPSTTIHELSPSQCGGGPCAP